MLSGAINKSESDPNISIVADVSQSPFLVPCQVLVYFYVLEESRSSKGGNKNSYRRRRRCSSERDEALTKRKRTKSHLSPQKRRVQEFLDKSCLFLSLSLPPSLSPTSSLSYPGGRIPDCGHCIPLGSAGGHLILPSASIWSSLSLSASLTSK